AIILIVAVFTSGCRPRQETAATSDLSGLVTGDGAEIRFLEPLAAAPDLEGLNRFFSRLRLYEPTLTRLMETAFHGEDAIVFFKASERCFLRHSPEAEVRAYYNQPTRQITFCSIYFDDNEP